MPRSPAHVRWPPLQYFFPKGTFFDDARDDEDWSKHWSAAFLAVHEPSLSCGDRPDEAYRIVTTYSFSPDSWSVRVFRDGREQKLVAVRLRLEPTSRRFSEVTRVDRDLSPPEWVMVRDSIDHVAFWSMSTEAREPTVMDGGGVLLEGRWKQRYHPVRRLLIPDSPLSNVVRVLQTLLGQKIDFSDL